MSLSLTSSPLSSWLLFVSCVGGEKHKEEAREEQESTDDRDVQEQGMDGEDGIERVCFHSPLTSFFYTCNISKHAFHSYHIPPLYISFV